jgi:hypothetical protein
MSGNCSIAALREKGWLDETTDRAQWFNMTRSFQADLQLVRDFPDIVIPENYSVVILDESAVTPLQDFVHPENAIYIFGRSTLNNIQDKIKHDYSVKIVTPEFKGMFGVSAAGALLYARSLQWP